MRRTTKAKIHDFECADARADITTDGELLARCARGDRDAVGVLFDRHHAMLHRFLGRCAGVDAPDLDDLLQLTFVRVFNAAGSYRGLSSVRTWLYAIAANVARRHVRTDIRRKRLLRTVEEFAPGGPPGPDAEVQRAELQERLAAAMAELPFHLRVVFVLCEIEQVPGVEAARVLGIRPGTLYRRLHDARKRLQRALAGEMGHEPDGPPRREHSSRAVHPSPTHRRRIPGERAPRG